MFSVYNQASAISQTKRQILTEEKPTLLIELEILGTPFMISDFSPFSLEEKESDKEESSSIIKRKKV